MTQAGKCDVCRSRKVKCDEARPSCGPCGKSNRACTYNSKAKSARAVKFVHMVAPEQNSVALRKVRGDGNSSNLEPQLRGGHRSKPDFVLALRKTRTASPHAGSFHKFAPVVVDENVTPLIREYGLSGQTTGLILRWKYICETLAPGDQEPYIVEEWPYEIAQRIGSNNAVDLALDCLIASMAAYINRSSENFAKTCRLNVKALAGVRQIILSGDPKMLQNEGMLAISWLYAAELLRGVDSASYKIHIRGRHELMANISKQGTGCSEVCKHSFFSSAHSDIVPSILAGRDSILDTPFWLTLAAPKFNNPDYPSAGEVEEYIARAFVRIPRLVRLVRAARQAPDDENARNEACALATDLYFTHLEDWVTTVIKMGLVEIVPTSDYPYIPHIPNSFSFVSIRVFKRLLAYWNVRCATASCVLTLSRLRPAMPCSALLHSCESRIADCEYEMANCIAMSYQWTMNAHPVLPVYELRLINPLVSAFGVWDRQELEATSAAEAERGRDLKYWATATMKMLLQKLNAQPYLFKDLQWLSEILTGGPLPSPVIV